MDHLVDLGGARKQVGSQIALAGNIDPVAGILRGTPVAIRERIRRDYELVGNPFLINAGCEIPPGTPAENMRALCEPIAWQR